jgi:SSS family solute:Na+ symporter
MYVAVACAIMYLFKWDQMSAALLDRPHGKSFLNPLDAFQLSDFNIWFVLITIVGTVYMTMAWQGNSGYNAAAINPHEQKMGGVLGRWRGGASNVHASSAIHRPGECGTD